MAASRLTIQRRCSFNQLHLLGGHRCLLVPTADDLALREDHESETMVRPSNLIEALQPGYH